MTQAIFESTIKSLTLLGRGKVRDIYAVDADKLLIVTSDRLSAFDVILPTPIPSKGKVLTQMADFWFDRLAHILPNQLTGIDPESVVLPSEREQVRGRGLVVKRLKPLPIEAVVRGYLIGSGWKDYQDTGTVCGIKLPAGHLVLYSSGSLHRVEPVTRGARLASFFWVQSLVRQDEQRSVLLELDDSIQALRQQVPDSPELIRLTGIYHNLLRQWTQT